MPDRLVSDALPRVRKQGEKSGSIGPRKIQAIIKPASGQRKPLRCVRDPAPSDQGSIDSRDCRKHFARAMGDNEGQLCLRELFPNCGNRRHRQDQVANPFELDEEEVQPALAIFCIAIS